MSKPRTATVTFSQVANATGYKVFWGTQTKTYTYSQDAGNNLVTKVRGLRSRTKYFFAGKAYNQAGESPFGTEVIVTL